MGEEITDIAGPNSRQFIARVDATLKKEGDVCLLLYKSGPNFTVVVTEEKNGDAEIFLTPDEMRLLISKMTDALRNE